VFSFDLMNRRPPPSRSSASGSAPPPGPRNIDDVD
jgi:hypothetical protein